MTDRTTPLRVIDDILYQLQSRTLQEETEGQFERAEALADNAYTVLSQIQELVPPEQQADAVAELAAAVAEFAAFVADTATPDPSIVASKAFPVASNPKSFPALAEASSVISGVVIVAVLETLMDLFNCSCNSWIKAILLS